MGDWGAVCPPYLTVLAGIYPAHLTCAKNCAVGEEDKVGIVATDFETHQLPTMNNV